ncbi:hypothetical protein D6D08_09153 [Aureobasidium pullulans]|nr:hypothetical protein D6D08_09153 [Aureobasidium pullulans]
MGANQSYGTDCMEPTRSSTFSVTTESPQDTSSSTTSIESFETVVKPTTKPVNKMVIFDPNQPPYDENPLDLSLGLHFSKLNGREIEDFDDTWKEDGVERWSEEDRADPNFDVRETICYKTLAERELISSFNKMQKTPEAESISKSGWLGLFCLQALPLYSNPQRPYLAIGVKKLGNWIGVHDQVVQLRDAWLPGMPIRYFIDKPEEEHDMDMNFHVYNDTGFGKSGGIRSELTRVLCPNNLRGVHIGMYDSLQIAKHGRGGDPDAGVDEWKRRLDGNHANSNYMSCSRNFWA